MDDTGCWGIDRQFLLSMLLFCLEEILIMHTSTLKNKMEKLIKSLPADANIEDAMERLYILYKIEKGIEQADSGKTVSHEEAKKKLKQWLD
jgi:predicted transcriptional regulator